MLIGGRLASHGMNKGKALVAGSGRRRGAGMGIGRCGSKGSRGIEGDRRSLEQLVGRSLGVAVKGEGRMGGGDGMVSARGAVGELRVHQVDGSGRGREGRKALVAAGGLLGLVVFVHCWVRSLDGCVSKVGITEL